MPWSGTRRSVTLPDPSAGSALSPCGTRKARPATVDATILFTDVCILLFSFLIGVEPPSVVGLPLLGWLDFIGVLVPGLSSPPPPVFPNGVPRSRGRGCDSSSKASIFQVIEVQTQGRHVSALSSLKPSPFRSRMTKGGTVLF